MEIWRNVWEEKKLGQRLSILKMKIYTLGTSNRPLNEFLEILRKYQIETVVDVRHFPTSKLFPHFKKENLEKFLKESGIEYYHLEKLGGYRKGGY